MSGYETKASFLEDYARVFREAPPVLDGDAAFRTIGHELDAPMAADC